VARVSGGVLAARAIAAHGIDTVFAFGGATTLDGLRVVAVRHGQTAAHAAHAWGHVNRSCGVALVTSPAGVAGAVGAIARSFGAQTPLVVIGDASRELDALALVRPITKWAGGCERAEGIPEAVATAFRHALAQPRGPVYLELPAEVLSAETDEVAAAPSRTTARTFGDPREVMRAAELLNAAERPVVVAGDAIWWDGAWKQLALFAENGRLPTFLTGSARGALRPTNELLFRRSQRIALQAADVVCLIGTSLDASELGDAKLVHIHADAREIGRLRAPDAGIVGDCAAVLGILADGVKNVRVDREPWLRHLRDSEEHDPGDGPFDAHRLGATMDEVLNPGAIVIADGADAVAAASGALRVHRPGHWLDAFDGAGAAYALGAKTASPDKRIVVLTDEVAFGSGAFGYETLERLGLAVLFVVAVAGDPPASSEEVASVLAQALVSTQPTIVSIAVGRDRPEGPPVSGGPSSSLP
jgi:acetolactate synthase-1/2/3 large subunit